MRPIIFHHIPRTGGSYVRHYLAKATGSDMRIGWRGVRPAPTILSEQMFASSHWAFDPPSMTRIPRPPKLAKLCIEWDPLYITWVRHPVDMAYSAYFHYSTASHGVDIVHGPIRPLIERIPAYKTVEEYIDAMLESDQPFYPEGVYTGLDFGAFDYVGAAGAMVMCLQQTLSHAGYKEFPQAPVSRINASCDMSEHRIDEVSSRLVPEFDALMRRGNESVA